MNEGQSIAPETSSCNCVDKLAVAKPIGLLECEEQVVCSVTFPVCLPPTDAFRGLFNRWIHEISAKDFGNVPSSVPALNDLIFESALAILI